MEMKKREVEVLSFKSGKPALRFISKFTILVNENLDQGELNF